MRHPRRRRAPLLVVLVALVGAGCGDNSLSFPEPGLLDVPMVNDTPQNTMIRFERTYEYVVLDQYELLFASDFRFAFSSQSDPALVAQFGGNWGKDDEIESTSHLFDGFTNSTGTFLAGASAITLSLAGAQFLDDPDAPAESLAYYKLVIVPTVSLQIDVPGTDGFEIFAPHDFHLVRGDAAVLDANQEATASRWYIRRWADKSPALAARHPGPTGPARILPASPSTWGSVKATYYR